MPVNNKLPLTGEAAAIAAANDLSNDYVVQDFDPLHWVRSFAAFNPHATLSYLERRLRTRRNLQIDP
jgi:hypothetical protein